MNTSGPDKREYYEFCIDPKDNTIKLSGEQASTTKIKSGRAEKVVKDLTHVMQSKQKHKITKEAFQALSTVQARYEARFTNSQNPFASITHSYSKHYGVLAKIGKILQHTEILKEQELSSIPKQKEILPLIKISKILDYHKQYSFIPIQEIRNLEIAYNKLTSNSNSKSEEIIENLKTVTHLLQEVYLAFSRYAYAIDDQILDSAHRAPQYYEGIGAIEAIKEIDKCAAYVEKMSQKWLEKRNKLKKDLIIEIENNKNSPNKRDLAQLLTSLDKISNLSDPLLILQVINQKIGIFNNYRKIKKFKELIALERSSSNDANGQKILNEIQTKISNMSFKNLVKVTYTLNKLVDEFNLLRVYKLKNSINDKIKSNNNNTTEKKRLDRLLRAIELKVKELHSGDLIGGDAMISAMKSKI